MKFNIKTALLSLVLITGLGGLSSCSSDTSTDEIQRMIDQSLNGQWTIVNITVNKADWKWKNDHYEYVAALPELTENIFKEGAVLGYIVNDQDMSQKPLPYINTYVATVNGQNVTFSETIDYDVQYRPNKESNVLFTIKDSDLANDPNAPQTYKFKIVLIW